MARPRTATADYQAVTIRLPREIMARCQAEAAATERSLNFMIVQIMREWYRRQSPSDEAAAPGATDHRHDVSARKPAFDTKKLRLGALCTAFPAIHQYGETGQSLRFIEDGSCRACTLAAKKAARQPQP